MTTAVQRLLAPRSIAILGASADFNKINGRTLKALLDKQYAGAIYPVNPKYTDIAGVKCYPDVASIPGPVRARPTKRLLRPRAMKLGLNDERQVRSAYAGIMDNAERYDAVARLDGAIVQRRSARRPSRRSRPAACSTR